MGISKRITFNTKNEEESEKCKERENRATDPTTGFSIKTWARARCGLSGTPYEHKRLWFQTNGQTDHTRIEFLHRTRPDGTKPKKYIILPTTTFKDDRKNQFHFENIECNDSKVIIPNLWFKREDRAGDARFHNDFDHFKWRCKKWYDAQKRRLRTQADRRRLLRRPGWK